MKKTLTLLTLLLAFLPSVLMAQAAKQPAKASVILVYQDVESEMQITDDKGNDLVVSEGMVIPVGSTIKTNGTSAELQLNPNKSIIKLSTKTTFKITALKEGTGPGSNDFELAAGKIRAVAAKLTGATKDPLYNVSTKTANCGVRGTDFAMMFDEATKKDWVCVQEGQVDFTNTVTGATVPVASGQFANTFDPVFQAANVGADKLAELFSDVGFVKLNPTDVPGKEIPATTQKAPEAKPAAAEEATPAKTEAAPDSPFMEVLKKLFGLEVGSITIEGKTYSKAVLTPVIAFDSFKLGLYLPIVYTNDMFNHNDWYRPAGNDEWSFGTDKSNLTDQLLDLGHDVALKIKYLEIGVQGTDPYYLKVGNLKTMSLGHGTVVHNFANDQEFPAVRKIGLNAGVKFGPVAIEGLADDLADPAVVGGRFAVDVVGDQVAVGVQTAADLRLANPKDLSGAPYLFGMTADDFGRPMLFVGGVDLQLFKLNLGGAFRTTAFADVNTLAVYLSGTPTIPGLKQGFDTTTIFHDGKLGSFGGETGVFGNILLVDYRLSFLVERGLYHNGIFQGNYYRTRNLTLMGVTSYINGSSSYRDSVDDTLTMGVFGSFGFDVGILALDGAYRWPFELKSNGSIGPSDADSLKIGLTIPKDKIPFIALSGGVSYERTGFVPSLRDGVNLFDANTVLKGEVVYGLAKGMDLVIGVGTTTMRDADGNVKYENNKPKVGPTVSIDTKVAL